MRKVHISLVGRETLPVYLGIRNTEPDYVILIHSAQTKQETDRIITELPNIQVKKIEFDPMDLRKIFSSIHNLQRDLNKDDIISLNLVGGTKFWSLALYSAFSLWQNVSINLIDQQNNIWDFRTQDCKKVEFDMQTNFKLYGNLPTKYIQFSSLTKEDFKVMENISKYRRLNYADFNALTSPTDKEKKHLIQQREGNFPLSRSSIQWKRPNFALLSLCKKNENTPHKIELNSPNSVKLLFNYSWFEVKIARILSKIYPNSEILLNCKFSAKQGVDKNEVDIILNTGTKLLFVECKVKINAITDIDKFRTVVRNYGGKGSKALFITETKMKEVEIEKCEESNIEHFSLQDYKNERSATNALQQLLNISIKKINK